MIPDANSGLNGCRCMLDFADRLEGVRRSCPCVSCLAPVCWASGVICLKVGFDA
ncbi:hypothetical protein A2U01_0049780, partial [Trifolium medium]|nr:hypothetical protein [Trifolium medium]